MPSRAVVKLEAIPLVVVSEKALTIPSLPAWATSRAAVLERTWEIPAKGEQVQACYRLPASLMPTDDMRRSLARARNDARDLLDYTPAKHPSADAEALVILAKMLKALPGQRLDEAGSEASTEAYLAALEDVPTWSLTLAMRNWYRGACGPDHDYRWRPGPAELRSIAMAESAAVHERWMACVSLLAAAPKPEYSHDHCLAMLMRLKELFTSLAKREDPVARLTRLASEKAAAEHAAAYKRTMDELRAE